MPTQSLKLERRQTPQSQLTTSERRDSLKAFSEDAARSTIAQVCSSISGANDKVRLDGSISEGGLLAFG